MNKMVFAYFKEDMDYENYPRYILNTLSGFFEMESDPTFSFASSEVWNNPDFIVLVDELFVSV